MESHECFSLMSSQSGEVGIERPRETAARTDSTESQYMVVQVGVCRMEVETRQYITKTTGMAKGSGVIGHFRPEAVIGIGN